MNFWPGCFIWGKCDMVSCFHKEGSHEMPKRERASPQLNQWNLSSRILRTLSFLPHVWCIGSKLFWVVTKQHMILYFRNSNFVVRIIVFPKLMKLYFFSTNFVITWSDPSSFTPSTLRLWYYHLNLHFLLRIERRLAIRTLMVTLTVKSWVTCHQVMCRWIQVLF